ncbi:MAG: FAD-dependent oxidoreductase, partial [Bacteroidota bacterium]|nr:FAD-dependent oxidoreductase [Bacteroidota bacterium]
FPPIKLGYTVGDGKVVQKHLEFYRERNKYIGAITPEPLYMDPGLRELPTQLGIDDDNKIEDLKLLNETLHQNGAKSIAHLSHPGRMANPKIPGNFFWSSTDKACENGGATPEKMDRGEMEAVIQLFVDSAKRAVASGFDIIELQFGHGYLLAQFISPAVNDRDDEYGGSFENRIKFPLEILKAVKNAVDVPLIARISGDEMIPSGFHLDEMIRFSKILKSDGIDALHVSAGTACSTPPWFFQHMFVPKGKTWDFARRIRDEVNIPTIFVGQVNSKEDIENLTKNYNADYIAIGRALIADPDFIGKCINKVKGNIRPCLACAEGCLGGVKSGQGLQCLVNPEIGRETRVFTLADKSKHYAVVGGGLAGMEAVLTLKKRGHQVDLYEKNELGGQFNLAPLTPNKKSMAALVPYFVKELKDNNINVIHKEAVKSDLINKYDGVIIASGSKPASIKIPGLDKPYWAEIMRKENLPSNKKILIIGGGLIGVDIATALIPLHNQVIIVKRTTDFGEDMEAIAKTLSLKMMKEKGTVFSDHTYIKKVEGRTVYADKNGKSIQFNDVDLIVVSTGMKSFNPLKDELENDIPVYTVGDAKKVGNAQDVINGAYEQTINL